MILILLFAILIVLIIIQVSRIEEPPPEGAIRVVTCTNCKAKYETRIKDIRDKSDERNICKKCKNCQLSYVWKCDECQYEFAKPKMYLLKNNLKKTMNKFKAIVESRRCPNCNSLATHPYSVNEFHGEKINRKKMKITASQ